MTKWECPICQSIVQKYALVYDHMQKHKEEKESQKCLTKKLVQSHNLRILKLEESAKDVRISVHVYTNGRDTAINEAIATYLETKQRCEKEKIQIALMEISK